MFILSKTIVIVPNFPYQFSLRYLQVQVSSLSHYCL
eukprot:02157.XXX_50761_50868_1 [CDS] Oithona nana genome sequencing.